MLKGWVDALRGRFIGDGISEATGKRALRANLVLIFQVRKGCMKGMGTRCYIISSSLH